MFLLELGDQDVFAAIVHPLQKKEFLEYYTYVQKKCEGGAGARREKAKAGRIQVGPTLFVG